MEKPKVLPINTEQKKIMLEYVQKYPSLAKQKFSAEYNFKNAQKHWEELGELLNSVPGGSKKTWRQWRKTWTDLKKNTKHKASGLKKYSQGTGGGPAIDDKITDIEKGILEIIGNVSQEGHREISETPVNFQFNDLSDIPKVDTEIKIKNDSNLNLIEIEDNTNLDIINNLYLNPIASISTERDEKHDYSDTPSSNNLPGSRKNPITSTSTAIDETNDHSYALTSKNLPGSGKKRLTITRRLENSQKISAEMLKTMESRNAVMEDYYAKKSAHFQHIQEYHKRKTELLQKTNEIAGEISTELKNIRSLLMRD